MLCSVIGLKIPPSERKRVRDREVVNKAPLFPGCDRLFVKMCRLVAPGGANLLYCEFILLNGNGTHGGWCDGNS